VAGLELTDIQGDILRAYGNAYRLTTYLFFRIDDADAGKTWLRSVLPRVTTAAPWPAQFKPRATLNIAVTAAGVRALGAGEPRDLGFSSEFCDGMAASAAILGDGGPSDPGTWEDGLHDGTLHVLATVNALGDDELRDALEGLRDDAARAGGVAVAYEQPARMLPNAREHFGYADGFAQPAVAGVDDVDRRVGGGVLEKGAWRPLAPGEFILGYEDEDTRVDPERRLPNAPRDPLGRSGTYMVWRKLRQDVALFRRTLRDAAARYRDGDHEKLAAKVVGRWRNGAPLVNWPDAPPPEPFDPKNPHVNAFGYAEDAAGLRCPAGAHIRRSNPRDILGFETALSFRHRIIRRGMPYGDPLLPEDATDDDGADRGLIFVCFNASISRQFEGIQAQWLNDGNALHLGHDSDFLLGHPLGTGKMTIPGRPPFLLGPQAPFVTTRGGGYLFVPGLRALATLSDAQR
jgi:Dyp-type peroxidase family